MILFARAIKRDGLDGDGECDDTELKRMLNLQELDLECCPKPVVFVLHNCLSAKVHSLT